MHGRIKQTAKGSPKRVRRLSRHRAKCLISTGICLRLLRKI